MTAIRLNPRIQAGSTGGTGSVAAGSYRDVAVTFPSAFGAAPTVVVGLGSTSTAGAVGSLSVAVASTSATGFTARVFNAGSSSREPTLRWVAVGG